MHWTPHAHTLPKPNHTHTHTHEIWNNYAPKRIKEVGQLTVAVLGHNRFLLTTHSNLTSTLTGDTHRTPSSVKSIVQTLTGEDCVCCENGMGTKWSNRFVTSTKDTHKIILTKTASLTSSYKTSHRCQVPANIKRRSARQKYEHLCLLKFLTTQKRRTHSPLHLFQCGAEPQTVQFVQFDSDHGNIHQELHQSSKAHYKT